MMCNITGTNHRPLYGHVGSGRARCYHGRRRRHCNCLARPCSQLAAGRALLLLPVLDQTVWLQSRIVAGSKSVSLRTNNPYFQWCLCIVHVLELRSNAQNQMLRHLASMAPSAEEEVVGWSSTSLVFRHDADEGAIRPWHSCECQAACSLLPSKGQQ